MTKWGLVCSIASWATTPPLMPKQASLLGSGVPLAILASPLEGHLLWDFASNTPGTARSSLFDNKLKLRL